MELLGLSVQAGPVARALSVGIDQTEIAVQVTPDRVDLATRPPLDVSILIEQSPDDGQTWFLLGACRIEHVQAAMTMPGKNGLLPTALSLRVSEQVYREDIAQRFNWPLRRTIRTDTKRTYHQLQLLPTVRVTVDTYTVNGIGERTGDAALRYSVEALLADRLPAALPLGRNSASLVGTFPVAESTVATAVTSGSRTSIAGSLICGFGGSWDSAGVHNNTITDSKSNAWTEEAERTFGASSNGLITLAYNIGGTRGASHTITNTKTGSSNATTVGGGEFDGVEASPTVVSNTATGNNATPSVAVTAGAASLYVGLCGYDNASPTTIDPDTAGGWAQVVEADENNDAQSFNAQYKISLSGANTASWALGASVGGWGAIVVAFTEAPPTRRFILGSH